MSYALTITEKTGYKAKTLTITEKTGYKAKVLTITAVNWEDWLSRLWFHKPRNSGQLLYF